MPGVGLPKGSARHPNCSRAWWWYSLWSPRARSWRVRCGERETHSRKVWILCDRESAYKDFESNWVGGHIENLIMFTCENSSKASRHPIMSRSSGMEVQNGQNGQCSELHSWHHSLPLPKWECKKESEICSWKLLREDTLCLHLKAAKFVFCGLWDHTIFVLSTGDFSVKVWHYFMFCFREILPSPLRYSSGDIKKSISSPKHNLGIYFLFLVFKM